MGRTKLKKISVFFIILLLPILFFSCGIPNYINFDNKIRIESIDQDNDQNLIEFNVKFNSNPYSEVDNFTTEPSIKLFYAISDNLSLSSPVYGNSSYKLSHIEPTFNTNYKKSSGNGIELPQETEGSLAAFYLYTDSNEKIRQFTISRSNLPKINKEGILVGTFYSKKHNKFNKPPKMDYVFQSDNLQQSFKLVYNEDNGVIEFINKNDNSTIDEFGSYNKASFNKQFYLEEDKGFYEGGDSSDRYIHIWGAIYGGRGSFTNIWWSNLEYLGYFEI